MPSTRDTPIEQQPITNDSPPISGHHRAPSRPAALSPDSSSQGVSVPIYLAAILLALPFGVAFLRPLLGGAPPLRSSHQTAVHSVVPAVGSSSQPSSTLGARATEVSSAVTGAGGSAGTGGASLPLFSSELWPKSAARGATKRVKRNGFVRKAVEHVCPAVVRLDMERSSFGSPPALELWPGSLFGDDASAAA
eukprot:CAMPEP_0118945298 /NCGR_PEP_ID=MMETSP1169-20130426/41972_1 /TAXON_ID=36882 /ORGANISM="Pyramimonas obovata, Strain CCMP722" /LENGTH=192 /DNA_ID=CAMNT_0006890977 /DNA_START=567 /DNA_END=1141 /DNA_ORIENTATION=+